MGAIRYLAAQGFELPSPTRKRAQRVVQGFRKPPLDRPRRIPRDDGVGGDILGHDRAGGDHRTCADTTAWQHDGAMPDPDVVTDMDPMAAPPFEELSLVALSREIGTGAIGEVRLRSPMHWMIAWVNPRHRGNRAELSN